jgi:superfamily II DNA or RNA helicase
VQSLSQCSAKEMVLEQGQGCEPIQKEKQNRTKASITLSLAALIKAATMTIMKIVMKIINVELFNRSAYFAGDFVKMIIAPRYFSFQPRNYRFMPAYKNGRWDGWIRLFDRRYNKVSSGLFLSMKDEIEKNEGIEFRVQDFREYVRFKDIMPSDRVYQVQCIRAMQRERSGGLILSATATGKTWIIGMYFKALKGSACFVVDEITLLYQAQKELEKVIGEEVGVVGNMEFTPERITVATIQTLHRHRENPRFGEWTGKLKVIVIDEVHIALNRRNIDTIKAIKPVIVFGLTATLELQKDSVRLPAYALCGPPIFEYHQEEGTEEGFLAPSIVCSVKLVQEGLLAGYQDEYKHLISESDVRNDCIVALVKEAHARGKHVVLIVERVRHLRRLSSLLESIAHRTVWGEKKVDYRLDAKKDFEKGDYRLIICNKVFKKGIDIKAIDCIIEASALSSKNDAIQKLGRGKRMKKGKDGLIYFDISDWSPPYAQRRKSPDWNRFQKASKSRLSAFRERKVPIVEETWANDAVRVLDSAEAKLARFCKAILIKRNGLGK